MSDCTQGPDAPAWAGAPDPARAPPGACRYPARVAAIQPAMILSVLVGILHVALFVALGGEARGRLPFLVLAAILGAYAGQAIGSHVGDPVRIGDFGLLSSSLVAWGGIIIVAIMSTLGPASDADARRDARR